jgi:hypothetical protein
MSSHLSSAIPAPRVVRRLALFLVCVLVFEGLMIAIMPRLHSGSVLKIAKDALLLRAGNDSWYYMAQGNLASRQAPNAIYETAFFERGIRFIYPPTALLLYRGCEAAQGIGIPPFSVFKALLLLSMFGTWLTVSAFFFRLFPDFKAAGSRERWKARLLLLALIYVFLPLVNAFFIGQAQTILNFLLMLGAYLWLCRRKTASGILIGLTCWVKPAMVLFLIWGLLRRQWSFAVSLVSMLLLGVAISLAMFGVHNTAEYYAVVHYLGRHGDALFTNQTLNGLLHRQMHVGLPVTWVYGYPPFNRIIYLATVISSALLIAAALVVPYLRRVSAAPVDFLIFAMAAVMASPIAWEHHYGIFFLVFLLWMPEGFRRWPVFAGILAMYLPMTDKWAPLSLLMYSPWTFLISHIYFGGMALFLYTLFRWKKVPALPSGDPERDPTAAVAEAV